MYINNYFNTTIWSEQKPEFIKSLTKASNKYIKAARNFPEAKAHIKKFGDFGRSYHSTPLTADNDFRDFRNYIGQKSWEYLDHQGFDMQQYTTLCLVRCGYKSLQKKVVVIIQHTCIGINTYQVFTF